MGMFDEIRCDIITPEFNLFQTKDIEGDIGGTGSLYYIDPLGLVWYLDYYGTCEWVRDPTQTKPWPYKRLQTGRHGRVRHMSRMTKYLTMYPSSFKGSWKDIPRYLLHIIDGRVQSHEILTSDARDQRNYSFQF